MLKEYYEPFYQTFLNIMPQFGIENVRFLGVESFDAQIETPGVVCIIGIIGDLKGNVIYAMQEDCAKLIASGMMGGMELDEFNEFAQSAISELGNIMAANACTEMSKKDVKVDVSTPTLMYGDFTVSPSYKHVIQINMSVNDLPLEIYVSLEKK